MSCENLTQSDYRITQDILRLAFKTIIRIYGDPNDYIPSGKVYQTLEGLKKISSELYQLEAENRIAADNKERENESARKTTQRIILKISKRDIDHRAEP